MREVKFRYFDTKRQEFITDCDVYFIDSNCILAGDLDNPPVVDITKNVVVSQYTGLNDSKGNGIYEGDIVKISDHPFQGSIDINGNYEIYYNEYMELSCGGWYLHRMRHWAEVIGNKFENPELLKGADKE